MAILRTGFEPTFRSLVGLFMDAANEGANLAYCELVNAGRISRYDTAAYERIRYFFSSSDEAKLLKMSAESIGSAIQYAARMGYDGYYAKSK